MKKIFKLLSFVIIFFSFTIIVNASTYYVTADGVRVRSSAKNANNIIGKLNYGDKIEVISLNNSWYKIKYGNGYGYITYRYVSKAQDTYNTNTFGLLIKKVSLKQKMSSSSKTITKIPKNSVVTVLNEKSGWAYVRYNEKLGYVKLSSLDKTSLKNESVIGAYSINYSLKNSNRQANMNKSVNLLNNKVIKNGQKFSFIGTVGKNNYLTAPEFNKKKKINGGGLSQVATTLYLSVREAQRNNNHINVTEQNRFGSKTPYAKLGEEAMINLTKQNDLVFTNKTGKSIKIYTYVNGNNVSIVISKVL